jgi:hypothetical protein
VTASSNDVPAKLLVDFPEIAAQWDHDGNGGLSPDGVSATSNITAWWVCPAGHRWSATVKSRTARLIRCPLDRVRVKEVDWATANGTQRHPARTLTAGNIPAKPGVYIWYRYGRPAYVGKADVLRDRIWKKHLGQSKSVGGSAFRRNVAAHLGFASAADIKAKRVALTADQLAKVRAWILSCQVAWIVCPSEGTAIRMENALKAEWKPPLTKI